MSVARYLAGLLLFCLAVPAVATSACHQQPVAVSVSGDPHAGHHQPQHDPEQHERSSAAIHGCIGCVPQPSGIGAPAVPMAMIGTNMVSFPAATLIVGDVGPPDPPPPRHAA